MGDKTGIEWTDATWNPVTGCDRTSPGCDNCYALTMAARLKRMGQANYQNDGDPRTSGPGFGVTCHPHMLDHPLQWRRPRRIFVNSMSDLFHPSVPYEFIVQVFAVMALASLHTFQVLTKRPQRMEAVLGATNPGFKPDVDTAAFELAAELSRQYEWHSGYTGFSTIETYWLPNVWLGTSIESDKYAFRADRLRFTPAAVRFISAEPLLGPLPSLDLTGIDWLVAGGESGPGARPMHPDWVRDLRDRCHPMVYRHDHEPLNADMHGGICPACESASHDHTAFLFKQWGGWAPEDHLDLAVPPATSAKAVAWLPGGEDAMVPVGKKAAGRLLDGRTWDEYPEVAS